MKSYLIKMASVLLVISTILSLMEKKNQIYAKTSATNKLVESVMTYTTYEDMIVYNNLTLEELGAKIEKELNSTLDGYGTVIASLALEKDVDPVVAASIILLETGCKWNCSSLVKSCNNIGGMRGNGCNGFAKFKTLDEGINAFINNISKNYYEKGLNTPELMNKKYATSKEWAQKVNNYVKAIMEN